MLAVMFECADRGVFSTGGEPWSDQEIAAAIGGDIAENLSCLGELLRKGVARRNSFGAIFSARMVRDEQTRASTKLRVQNLRVREKCNAPVTVAVTPVYEDENENEVLIKNLEPKPEECLFDVQQATTHVFLEVGMAGNENRMVCNDAVNAFIHKNKSSPKIAAESLVSLWKQYESTPMEFKRGVAKFFKEGLWSKPSAWGGKTKQLKTKTPLEMAREEVGGMACTTSATQK